MEAVLKLTSFVFNIRGVHRRGADTSNRTGAGGGTGRRCVCRVGGGGYRDC